METFSQNVICNNLRVIVPCPDNASSLALFRDCNWLAMNQDSDWRLNRFDAMKAMHKLQLCLLEKVTLKVSTETCRKEENLFYLIV